MKSMFARMMLPLLLLGLGGCLFAPPSPAAKSAHTRSLETWYPDKGAQALAVAAELGDAAEVRRLMKEEGVNPDKHFSPEGMPLIAWPVFTRNPAGLKAMLENGADPNAAMPYPLPPGRTPRNNDNALVLAAKQEDPIYLQHLLDHGGDPDTRNVNNETLLLQAFIWQDQWQNVQVLVEGGADVNALSQAYPIISNYAMMGGFKKVHWLLEHGATPDNKGHNKSTLNAIFWKPMKEGEGREWQVKCQQWILANGYKRPPLPEHYRRDREAFGYETDESKVALPEVQEVAP